MLIRVHGGAGKIMGLVTVPPTALLLTFVLDKGTVTAAIEDVDTGLGTPNIRAVSKDLVLPIADDDDDGVDNKGVLGKGSILIFFSATGFSIYKIALIYIALHE